MPPPWKKSYDQNEQYIKKQRHYFANKVVSSQSYGFPTNPSYRKSVLNIHWTDWCWKWSYNTLASWCKELMHWKRPWCWERLKAGREGADRGWDGWMASTLWWIWVWASSGSWWWTGKPDVLQSMRLQRVGRSWETELNWTEVNLWSSSIIRGRPERGAILDVSVGRSSKQDPPSRTQPVTPKPCQTVTSCWFKPLCFGMDNYSGTDNQISEQWKLRCPDNVSGMHVQFSLTLYQVVIES